MRIEEVSIAVLNTNSGQYIIPEELLTVSDSLEVYLEKRGMKILTDPAREKGTYLAESSMPALLASYREGKLPFLKLTTILAEKLQETASMQDEARDMDVIFFHFSEFLGEEERQYLGILELEHKSIMTHQIEDDGNVQLIQYPAGLPSSTQPVYGYACVPFDGSNPYIKSKSTVVNGEAVDCLKDDVLGIETALSDKKVISLLLSETQKMADKHGINPLVCIGTLKQQMLQAAADSTPVEVEQWSGIIFSSNTTAKAEYIDTLHEKGVAGSIPVALDLLQKQGETIQIKTDIGVKIVVNTESLGHDVGMNEKKGLFQIGIQNIGKLMCK